MPGPRTCPFFSFSCEWKKSERNRGGTNVLTKRTLTPDEVIGEILEANYSFIPIAIGPHGEIGSLFNRFLHGGNTLPLPTFNKDRPNAERERAAKRCIYTSTPWGILDKADKQWKHAHGDRLFGANYLTPLPSSWADQQLGLTFITHISNHIFSSFKNIKHTLSSPPPQDQSHHDDDSSEYDNENEWMEIPRRRNIRRGMASWRISWHRYLWPYWCWRCGNFDVVTPSSSFFLEVSPHQYTMVAAAIRRCLDGPDWNMLWLRIRCN